MRKKDVILMFVVLFAGIFILSCSRTAQIERGSEEMVYKIKRATKPVELNGNWSKGQWARANGLELKNYMGDKPEHFPKTEAKLLYDADNIYVFFRVQDNYVRAATERVQGPVWGDSCVEFFFSPDTSQKDVYFNLEINCGGTMYFRYNDLKNNVKKLIDVSDCEKVKVYHSLPAIIKEEIKEPTVWLLSYKLPLSVISKYSLIQQPKAGVVWAANFYKCADQTSHPHWLTWRIVNKPKPDFHQPEFFGTIEFE